MLLQIDPSHSKSCLSPNLTIFIVSFLLNLVWNLEDVNLVIMSLTTVDIQSLNLKQWKTWEYMSATA